MIKSVVANFKTAFSEYSDDKVARLSAALAFYTMLSIAPMLVICIKIAGVVFGDEAARGQVGGYLTQTMGAKAAESVQQMVANAGQAGGGVLATIISTVILLFSASNVFGELQDSLNTIWEVKPKPDRGIMGTIKDRFFSLTLVLGTAFLLLVSLVASTVLSGALGRLGGEGIFWQAVNFIIAFAVVTGLFAVILKYLPDVKIPWSDVWAGALLTALLFSVGKLLLGIYLGRASTTSVYGAAGSLVAMLLWVYYTAQIFFIGAEYVQASMQAKGRSMEPTVNAVKLTEGDRIAQGMPHATTVMANADAAQKRDVGTRPVAGPRHPDSVRSIPWIDSPAGRWVVMGAGLVAGVAFAKAGSDESNKAQMQKLQTQLAAERMRLSVRQMQPLIAMIKARAKR